MIISARRRNSVHGAGQGDHAIDFVHGRSFSIWLPVQEGRLRQKNRFFDLETFDSHFDSHGDGPTATGRTRAERINRKLLRFRHRWTWMDALQWNYGSE